MSTNPTNICYVKELPQGFGLVVINLETREERPANRVAPFAESMQAYQEAVTINLQLGWNAVSMKEAIENLTHS